MAGVRLGIVGAGYWARAAHVPSLAGSAAGRFTAIASAHPERARAAAEALGIPRAFDDWHALVESDDVDAVVVAAPAPLHHPVALAAFAAGKHVLCEAPLGCTLAEAREMHAAAKASGLVHAYVRPRPWLYGGAEVARALAERVVGEPRSASFAWHDTPWVAADPIDTWRARADMGPPVLLGVSLAVLTATLGPLSSVHGGVMRIGPPPSSGLEPAPDAVVGTHWTASGIEVAVNAGRRPPDAPESAEPHVDGLTVSGSAGALHWRWERPPTIRIERSGSPTETEELPYPLEPDLARAWPFTRGFVDAIRHGRPAAPDFAAGVLELAAVDAFLRAKNAPVDVDASVAG